MNLRDWIEGLPSFQFALAGEFVIQFAPLLGRVRCEALEPLEREVCRAFGHVMLEHRAGEPVTAFQLCHRCGKIGDRL